MYYRRIAGIIIVIACASRIVLAQDNVPDTLRIDLRTADTRLLAGNLLLVAQKFTVGEHEAIANQAGLWDNPNVAYEQSIYNRFTGQYFPTGEDGQFAVALQQPFAFSGRRGKQVNVERVNTEL